MAREFIYDNVDREGESPQKSVSSGNIEKGLKRLLLIAGIVIVCEFIWLFGIRPCIPFSVVEVTGFQGFDRGAVLEYAGIDEKASFASVSVKQTEKVLLANHLVESARVAKRFPDRLSIYLKPRTAVALWMVMIDGQQMPMYFDRHGVVLKIGNMANNIPLDNLPVISGLVFTDPEPGTKLPDILVPFLNELALIEERAPVLLEAISEIKINLNPRAFNGFDLVLYPRHNHIRVQLGGSINEDMLRYVLVILDAFKTQSVQPVEIDIRSIMSPYSVKEVPSG
jgi:cell division protein FtsQ